MKLPNSFGQLTVLQYQKSNEILTSEEDSLEKHIKLIAYLSGRTCEFVESHTPRQIGVWVRQLSFLNKPEIKETWAKRVYVNGRWYMPIIDSSTHPWSAISTLKHFDKKDSIKHLNEMLACVYVPMNFMGRPKAYKASRHKQIAEDMLSVKLDDVYGFLEFKKKVLEKLNPITQIFLNESLATIQETIEWQKKELAI